MAETAMSTPRLPAELLDYVVDSLHDTKHALRNCCLVSKSLIPRSRMYLFADVRFDTEGRLRSWKETFPDPQTSPACYAKTLYINCLHIVTVEDVEAGGWIRGFSRVVHLEVVVDDLGQTTVLVASLPRYRGFSPAAKAVPVKSPILSSSRIFDFTLSFPLLEDLTMVTRYKPLADNMDSSDGLPTVARPSIPPMTGSLELFQWGGIKPITRRLLSISGGIHFRKLIVTWHCEEDLLSTQALVEGCSHTLESLHITCDGFTEQWSALVDLSKATGLKDVAFRTGLQYISWVTVALKSITPENRDLRQILIYAPYYSKIIDICGDVRQFVMGATCRQWSDLDLLLVQIWGWHSICPGIVSETPIREGRDMRECFELLMPVVTRRGIVDLVEWCAS